MQVFVVSLEETSAWHPSTSASRCCTGTDKHQNHWFDRKYGKLQDMTLPDMQIVRNKTV